MNKRILKKKNSQFNGFSYNETFNWDCFSITDDTIIYDGLGRSSIANSDNFFSETMLLCSQEIDKILIGLDFKIKSEKEQDIHRELLKKLFKGKRLKFKRKKVYENQ